MDWWQLRQRKKHEDGDVTRRGQRGGRGGTGTSPWRRRAGSTDTAGSFHLQTTTTPSSPITSPRDLVTPRSEVTARVTEVVMETNISDDEDVDDMMMIVLPSNGTLITSAAADMNQRGTLLDRTPFVIPPPTVVAGGIIFYC